MVDSRASGIMLVLCLVWGLQQVAIKVATPDVSALLQVSIRSGVAALLVWITGRLVLRERWLRGVLPSSLLVGVLFAAEFLFLAEGLNRTSAAHMAVFVYTAPMWAAVVLHFALPEERLAPRQWAGIALAFLGIVVAFFVPTLTSGRPVSSESLLGDLLGLCGGAAWGFTTVVIRLSRLGEAPPTQTLFAQLGVTFALLLPLTALTGQLHFSGTPTAWASLSFQSIIVAFGSFLAWFWLLRCYLAAQLGVLSFMTPLFGVALGVVLLGEPLTPGFAVGALLVLAGLMLVNAQAWRPFLRRRPRRPH